MKDSILRKNFYELLGLCRDATDLEIQIAYSDLSRIYDPESRFFADIIEEPVTDEQREVFDRITQAYHTLLDEAQRRQYDRSIAPEASPEEWVAE